VGSPDADLAVAGEDALHDIGGCKFVILRGNGVHDLAGSRDISLVEELFVLGKGGG
jgi:hypothetical protein